MKRFLPFTFLFMVIFWVYCTKNTLEPALNPEIVNEPDRFEFKINDIRNITQQLTYQWQNNGINATIYNGSVITEGEASLILLDVAGDEVFSLDLTQTGDFFSGAGSIGGWSVRLNLNDVHGTVHFRVNRRP